jgi:hypothetical protein
MIIPKITVHCRITAETGSAGQPLYVLIMYINSVTGYDTLTGESTGTYGQLPLELFLYRKMNNSAWNTPGSTERVRSGAFIRIMEPDDIDTRNYTFFGTEKLIWGTRDDIRMSVGAETLMPCIGSGGTTLTREGALTADAPVITFNRSGYYKSKVFIATSSDAGELSLKRDLMLEALKAFISKYLSVTYSPDALQDTVYETEDI